MDEPLRTRLLPCPFCGADARYRPDHYVIVPDHDKPECQCVFAGELTVSVTAERWNRRAELSKPEPGLAPSPSALRATDMETALRDVRFLIAHNKGDCEGSCPRCRAERIIAEALHPEGGK